MADSLQSVGSKAIEKAPQPLRRALGSLGTQFHEEDGPTEAMAGGLGPNSRGMIAGVAKGSPNVVSVMQPDTFRENAPQLVTHEGVHEWQNNLPPSIQAKIPADNAADPYNYGGTQHIQQLVHSGGSILDLPREQQAAAMQYGQAQGMPEPYKSLASTIDKVPLSTVDETDPNAKLINTHPRSPQVPPGSVPGMNFAGETYKKGQPAPGDPPPPSGATIDPAPPAGATLDEGGGGPPAATAPTPSMGSRILEGAENLGKGAVKAYGSAAANIDDLVAKHVPGGQFLTTPLVGGKTSEQARQDLHQESAPHGNMQKVGNFLGNASQFAIPGAAGEGAVAKGAALAGDAAKFIRPAARIGATALSSGTVNRAQGGGFGAGAAAGALGAGAGEVLNAAAPAVAEKALGIRGKFDRSFNKEPGKAALEETSGLRPETVANSAKARIGELSKDTENMADQASTKARPQPRGLLPAPTEDVPLHSAPDIAGTPSQPTVLNQPDRPMPKMLESQTGNRTLPSSFHSDIFPDQLPQGRTNILEGEYQPMAGETQGMRADQYMGQVPGDRGGVGQVQGVLRQRPSAPIGQAPIPTTEANRMASLVPARQAVSNAIESSGRENTLGTGAQLENMNDFLRRRYTTGEQIPENVTPRELLDLRRGFNEEHGRWNPDLHDTTVGTGRQAYGALTNEFHRVLPEATANDATVSNLIPVKNRASITALGDNPLQKAAGRVAAHTGAGASGIAGAYEGKKEGGIPGAIAGGLAGVVAPEIISSPTGQMAVARMMHSATSLPLVRGAILNAVPGRKNGDQE